MSAPFVGCGDDNRLRRRQPAATTTTGCDDGVAHDVRTLARGRAGPTGYDFGVKLAITGERLARVVDVVEGELTFGRSGKNDVVLDGAEISARHARLVKRGAHVFIADLASDHGTWVNGGKLAGPHALAPGDEIAIGHYRIEVHAEISRVLPRNPPPPPLRPRDGVEAQLLAQIAARDAGSRDVYADWLDDRGLQREAEFVRAQDELVQLRAPIARDRQREVSAAAVELDPRWRLAVSRPAIERCAPEFAFRCPKDWGTLARTDDPGVRFCSSCTKPVYYAATVAEARERAANRECVALDLTAARRDGDLDAPYGRHCVACGFTAGTYGQPICARCGADLPNRPMMVGAIA